MCILCTPRPIYWFAYDHCKKMGFVWSQLLWKRNWSIYWISYFGLDVRGSSQNEYGWIRMVETFSSHTNRFKPICGFRLGMISYLHSALFQGIRFVLITPFLEVLGLTWFKVCFIFQIIETLSTNDRFVTHTITVNQFLETIIAKSSLKISGLNVMDYFQAFFSLLS